MVRIKKIVQRSLEQENSGEEPVEGQKAERSPQESESLPQEAAQKNPPKETSEELEGELEKGQDLDGVFGDQRKADERDKEVEFSPKLGNLFGVEEPLKPKGE